MKKTLVALSLLGLLGVAHADDGIKNGSDGFSVFAGANNYKTMNESSTGYGIGANYTKYLNNNVFVQPSIHYNSSQSGLNDSQLLGYVDLGYTFRLENNITISPKIGVGFHHTIADDASDTKVSYNAGVEVGFAKRWSVSLETNYLSGGNGRHVDITTLSLGYKF